jgi:hypothetical protein
LVAISSTVEHPTELASHGNGGQEKIYATTFRARRPAISSGE